MSHEDGKDGYAQSETNVASDPVAFAFDFEELATHRSPAYGYEGKCDSDDGEKVEHQLGRVVGGRLWKRSSCMVGTAEAGRGFLREGVVMTAISCRSVMEVRGT